MMRRSHSQRRLHDPAPRSADRLGPGASAPSADPEESGETRPPILHPLRSRAGHALIAATVLASMIGFIDAYMVNVAVPAIGRDLNADVSETQWVVTGYLVTVAALLLLAGALADHFGRRRVLTAGLLVMSAASVACALAPSPTALIVARLVQGAGGALVVPSSLALLNGTLRGEDRALGIGVWAGLSTLATTLGPYGAGWLVDHTTWRLVFLLNVPLVAIALLALRRLDLDEAGSRGLTLDYGGGLLAVLALGGVIFALTQGPSEGWRQRSVLVSGAVGIAAAASLVYVERHSVRPMLRFDLFRSRQFSAINVATVLFYGALAGAGYLVVLQCQLTLGYTAAQAGAALVPESVVFLLLAPLMGGMVRRWGSRWPMATGMLVSAAAFCWVSGLTPGEPYTNRLLPAALLWGLGIGLTVAPLTAGVLAAVHDRDLGEAAAVNDAASRVGGVVMIALIPLMLGTSGFDDLSAGLARGFQTAMLVMAGASVVAAVVTAALVRRCDGPSAAAPLASPRVHPCAVPASEPVPHVEERRA